MEDFAPHADYDFEEVDVERDDAALDQVATLEAISFHFNLKPSEQERADRREKFRLDDTRILAAKPKPVGGLDNAQTLFVAANESRMGELTTRPGHTEPCLMATGMMVRPEHTRRGLMQILMREQLAWAHAQGAVFAVLTATNAQLYGRFGYGVASWAGGYKFDTSAGWQLRQAPTGQVRAVEADVVTDLRRQLFDEVRLSHRGQISRPPSSFYASDYSYLEEATNPNLRFFAHVDEDNQIDGYASCVVKDEDGKKKVVVDDLLATNANAEAALIDVMARIELTTQMVMWLRQADWSFPLRLVDYRRAKFVEQGDFVWLRILDLDRALQAREWIGEGEVRLGLVDPLENLPAIGSFDGGEPCPVLSGNYRIRIWDGQATCERLDAQAQVDATLDMSAFASLYMGAWSALQLAEAGQLQGDAAKVQALFGLPTSPYTLTLF